MNYWRNKQFFKILDDFHFPTQYLCLVPEWAIALELKNDLKLTDKWFSSTELLLLQHCDYDLYDVDYFGNKTKCHIDEKTLKIVLEGKPNWSR